MTKAFLDALGLGRATFQVFPETEGSTVRPHILHGPYPALERRLRALNGQGAGVFFMVNKGDLRGRRAQNVLEVTSCFADLDGAPLYDEYPLEPTAIVESSPGRYHLYWAVYGADLGSFAHVQQHTAQLLGGDASIIDLPRVMRLPSFQHLKGEPFTVRVLQLNEAAAYSAQDYTDAFGVPEYTPPRTIPAMPQATQDFIHGVRSQGSKAKGRATLLDRVASAGSGNRNHTLFRVASALANDVARGELDRDTMRAELEAAATANGLGQREVEQTISSALRYVGSPA